MVPEKPDKVVVEDVPEMVRISLLVDRETYDQARELGVNMSHACRRGLQAAVDRVQAGDSNVCVACQAFFSGKPYILGAADLRKVQLCHSCFVAMDSGVLGQASLLIDAGATFREVQVCLRLGVQR